MIKLYRSLGGIAYLYQQIILTEEVELLAGDTDNAFEKSFFSVGEMSTATIRIAYLYKNSSAIKEKSGRKIIDILPASIFVVCKHSFRSSSCIFFSFREEESFMTVSHTETYHS